MAARLFVVSLLGAAACADEHCAEPPSDADGAPVIDEFELLGQLDGDPWTLVFGTSFTDSTGDLFPGFAEFNLSGEASGQPLELADMFRQSGIAANAKSGKIAFPLRFQSTVRDGAEVWLGVQLRDAAGQRSNCAAMKLHFAVEPAQP